MEDKYYIELKEKALKVEIYDRAKDYAKDKNKVNVYFEMGELLSKAGRKYGKNIINNYSEKLMIEVGKKYNYRTLYRMRKFYELFSSGKLTTMWSKITWSHYREILSLKDIDKNIKTIEENDTVGIIICKQDNEYVIKYCSDNRIIAREYKLM